MEAISSIHPGGTKTVLQSADLSSEASGSLEAILALIPQGADRSENAVLPPGMRAFPRWPVAERAYCFGCWGNSPCLISDLSEGGLCLTTGHGFRAGEEVVVIWRLEPDSLPVQAVCSVKHAVATRVGVEFLNVTPIERQRIREFLRVKAAP